TPTNGNPPATTPTNGNPPATTPTNGNPPVSTSTPFASGYALKCNTTQTTNQANTFSGVLAYTRYNIEQNGKVTQTPDNVKQVAYTYTAGKFTLGAISTITTVLGADGIVTIPDGSLIIGGEGATWKV